MSTDKELLDLLEELIAVVKVQKERIEKLEVQVVVLAEVHRTDVEALHDRISNFTFLVN